MNPKQVPLEIPTKLCNTCTVRRRYGYPSCDDVIEVPSAVRCGPGHARRVCVPRRRGGKGRPLCDCWGKPAYLVCVTPSVQAWAAVRWRQFMRSSTTTERPLQEHCLQSVIFSINIVYLVPHTIARDYQRIAYQPVPKIGKDHCRFASDELLLGITTKTIFVFVFACDRDA